MCGSCNFPKVSWQHTGACLTRDKVPPSLRSQNRATEARPDITSRKHVTETPGVTVIPPVINVTVSEDAPAKRRGRPASGGLSQAERAKAYRERKKNLT